MADPSPAAPAATPPASPSPWGISGDRDRSRLWLIPLACLLAAILVSLTAFWAVAGASLDPTGGRGDGTGRGGDPVAGNIAGGSGSQLGGTRPEHRGSGSDSADAMAGRRDAVGGDASTPASSGDPSVAHTGPAAGTPSLDDVPPAPELGFTVSLDPATPAPAAQGDEATGGGGPATFFGQTGRGSRFVYVIDKSGSMEGSRFGDATFELIRSIRALRDFESFAVVFYDTTATPMPRPGLLKANAENKEWAIEWIRSISIGGGTEPSEAMRIALAELKPDTIWLLSDGMFNRIEAVDEIAQLNQDGRVQINTIAFHEAAGEVALKRVAEQNDGDYRFVPPP